MSDHCETPAAPVVSGRPRILLAGNPNVGKTTLFNALTGSRAKVSNYPGITVEKRAGELPLSTAIADLVDLPGTYSLNARSAEEQVAFDALLDAPDAAIVVLDATQLQRSAYLLLQIQELGLRVVVALTMVDEAGAAAPDARALAKALDCEVVPVTARTKLGLRDLVAAVDRVLRTAPQPRWRWNPSPALRSHLDNVIPALPANPAAGADARALWALSCIDAEDELDVSPALRAVMPSVERALDDESVLGRWKFLDGPIAKLAEAKPDRSRTERIDRVLLHRGVGFAVFLGVMAVVFMSLFWWASPVMDLIDHGFKSLGAHIHDALGDAWYSDLITSGIIGGVGTVMVFLPQILLLFLFLGFLEDCGYLARVAYLMDRVMRAMNLHGRAFVPMLSGFACAVPALMATRTMERRRDRILTMLVVPLMTCSARLPVYTLIIGALIPGSHLTQGLLMVFMYVFSATTALIAAWALSKTVKPLKAKRLPFFIELPPYRFPRVKDVLRMMWGKSSMFLREAGTVILACSVALWALLYFPHHSDPKITDPSAQAAYQLEHSYGGQLGHAIEPAIEPLGFDWKIGVGLIGAFAAREVFVSTLGIVYSIGDDADEHSVGLRTALKNEKQADGTARYTPLVGISLMIFFALAMQCMSTLAVVRRETRSWRWPAFLFGYMSVLAYVTSLLVYQGGRLLGLG